MPLGQFFPRWFKELPEPGSRGEGDRTIIFLRYNVHVPFFVTKLPLTKQLCASTKLQMNEIDN